ncbi:MAG: hypothetical protein JWM56_1098 [Candidatus Peribacteria bacterium]|nr:hypothetical protein [Candidatus Peribacteria bacterium]
MTKNILETDTAQKELEHAEKRDANARDLQAEKEWHMREDIRFAYREKLRACAEDSSTAWNLHDADEYVESLVGETGLEAGGFTTHAKKMEIIRANERFIEETIQHAKDYGQKALAIIDHARSQEWISNESAAEWRGRLKQGDKAERKKFIDTILPAYEKNWEKLSTDIARMKTLQKELHVTDKEVPELHDVLAKDFSRQKYPKKQDLVDMALAALAAYKKSGGKTENTETEIDMKELFQNAKNMLTNAAREGILAQNKISHWLRRIFESKADPALIQDFLSGKGKMPLTTLMQSWRNVRGEFNTIETKRESKGTPRSFHFVHANVFLSWHYERRKAYVNEADKRFEDVERERVDFLRVRHELDAHNWEEADALIRHIQPDSLTIEDNQKLESMQKYLRENRIVEEKPPENPPTSQVVQEMEDALNLISVAWVRDMLRKGCNKGYQSLWTLSATFRNREWSWEKGYLDAEKEETLRQAAKEETYEHIEEGHGNDFENNSFTGDTARSEAVRTQKDATSSQVLHVNASSAESFLNTVIEPNKTNRQIFYYTSAIPEGLNFSEHKFIIEHVFPILKRNTRILQDRGLNFFAAKGSPENN